VHQRVAQLSMYFGERGCIVQTRDRSVLRVSAAMASNHFGINRPASVMNHSFTGIEVIHFYQVAAR
jgi:hypothetical protein